MKPTTANKRKIQANIAKQNEKRIEPIWKQNTKNNKQQTKMRNKGMEQIWTNVWTTHGNKY